MNDNEVALPADPIGVPDAARLLGRRAGFLYRRVSLGKLRAWRVGGTAIVLSRADVLALIEVSGPEVSRHERAMRQLREMGAVGG